MTQETASLSEKTVRDRSAAAQEPEWLLQRRLDAWRAFEAMAMPTGLEEEWRRTDLSEFDLAGAIAGIERGPERPARLSTARARSEVAGLIAARDGRTAERYLAPETDNRVLFLDLQQAAREHPDLVRDHLHSLVTPTEWKLQALQAAVWSGGALVYVPRGVEVALPLRYVSSASGPGLSLFPHLLVIAEDDASVAIIQEGRSPDGEKQSFVSGAIEIIAGANARVQHFDVQRWGSDAYSFSTLRARLGPGAELTSVAVGLGGRLTKARVEALLVGEASRANLIGVSYGDGRQHFDYNTLQDHLGPRTSSDLLYKAALTDRASEVWYGLVRIHKGASQSDANQTSRNLLLSDTAKAAPIPVLEIEAYDILRCSHGATAGPLDEEQLFYMESRGIPADVAEELLVDAFFREVFDRIPNASVRKSAESALAEKTSRARRQA